MQQLKPQNGYILIVALLMLILVTLAASGIAYFVSYTKSKDKHLLISKYLQLPTTLTTTNNSTTLPPNSTASPQK